MSSWEESVSHIDLLTLSIVIELQLEDTEELASRAKGKGREGTPADSELALQMYIDDLKACSATVSNRKMAQSMALAVLRDAQSLHQENIKEQQIAQNREMAASLQGSINPGAQVPNGECKRAHGDMDIWEDAEILSKVIAMYMPEPEDTPPPSFVDDTDSDVVGHKVVAESSTWAAARKDKDKKMLGHCVACGDE